MLSSRQQAKIEALEAKNEPTFELNVMIKGIGLSVVDRKPQELLYATFKGTCFRPIKSDSPLLRHCHLNQFERGVPLSGGQGG